MPLFNINNQGRVAAFLLAVDDSGPIVGNAATWEALRVTSQGELWVVPPCEPTKILDETINPGAAYDYTAYVNLKGYCSKTWVVYYSNTGGTALSQISIDVASEIGGGGIVKQYLQNSALAAGSTSTKGARFWTSLDSNQLDAFSAGSMRFGAKTAGAATTLLIHVVAQRQGVV